MNPAPYPWPVQPPDQQHPVRGFLGDPRIAAGGRTFHFGIDIAAPAGTPVYAVAPGKVSYGSQADVTRNGGIVVVEASRQNFGYWHVKPAVQPGTRIARHGLLGHIADQPEDWGHVHFAESTHGPTGITYWNPIRAGAITPFNDFGPPVIEAIVTSLPAQTLNGLVDFSVKAHDNTPIAITQPNPPGWHGLPVTPARIRSRLLDAQAQPVVPWHTVVDHSTSLHPNVEGNPPTDINFDTIYTPDTTQNNPHTPGVYHFWLTRNFDTASTPTAATNSKSKPATRVETPRAEP